VVDAALEPFLVELLELLFLNQLVDFEVKELGVFHADVVYLVRKRMPCHRVAQLPREFARLWVCRLDPWWLGDFDWLD
jgi:hypothetical protein